MEIVARKTERRANGLSYSVFEDLSSDQLTTPWDCGILLRIRFDKDPKIKVIYAWDSRPNISNGISHRLEDYLSKFNLREGGWD